MDTLPWSHKAAGSESRCRKADLHKISCTAKKQCVITACTNLLRCERHKAEILAAVEVFVLWKVDVHHLQAKHPCLMISAGIVGP